MQLMSPAKLAILLHFQTVLHGTLVFCRRIIFLLAFRASQNNIVAHKSPSTGAHDQD